MNVFKYELRQYRRSLVSWVAGMSLILFIYLPIMPIFLEESAALREMFGSLNQSVLSAINIDMELVFGTVGFYGFMFTFISIAAAIQAASLGLGIISKENRMKTADFLLSKPRTRLSIFASKLLAALCVLVVTQSVFYIISTAGMYLASNGNLQFRPFMLINLTYTFQQLAYMAVGMFLAMILPKVKSVISATMALVMGTFIIGMLANLAEIEALRILSPLRYFDTNYIISNSAYDIKYLMLSIVVTVVLIVASGVIYIKRDVKAV